MKIYKKIGDYKFSAEIQAKHCQSWFFVCFESLCYVTGHWMPMSSIILQDLSSRLCCNSRNLTKTVNILSDDKCLFINKTSELLLPAGGVICWSS